MEVMFQQQSQLATIQYEIEDGDTEFDSQWKSW